MKTLYLLGPVGSFSDEAADALAGRDFQKKYVSSFVKLLQVFKRTRKNNYALVPIRNKIIGKIAAAEPVLKIPHLKRVKKIRIPVCFVLAVKTVSKKSPAMAEIKKIYCSEIAYQQCRNFIKKHLPHAKVFSNFSVTSFAYKKIVQLAERGGAKTSAVSAKTEVTRAAKGQATSVAAIGSLRGARLYTCTVLSRNIQNEPDDWTEFVLLTKGE